MDDLIEKIKELAEAGKNQVEIGKTLHVKRETVGRIMTDHNITIKSDKTCTIPKELLKEWDRFHRKYGRKEEEKHEEI